MTLYIPTVCVGGVIGRRGSTIAQIQRQAQQLTPGGAPPVRVSIVGNPNNNPNNNNNSNTATTTGEWNSNANANAVEPGETAAAAASMDNPIANTPNHPPSSSSSSSLVIPYTHTEFDWSCPDWTPVVIRAIPEAALFVSKKLGEICQSDQQDCIMDLPLGRQRHATIVGKRGTTLMQLSANTNVRIMVPPKSMARDLVQLEGKYDDCVQCLQALAQLFRGAGAPLNNTRLSVQVVIQNLPSQTKLRSVGRKTDTIIKKKKLDDTWQLTIMGNNEPQVHSAVQLLQKWGAASHNEGGGDPTSTAGIGIVSNQTAATTAPTSTNGPNTRSLGGRGGGRGGRGGRGGGGRGKKGIHKYNKGKPSSNATSTTDAAAKNNNNNNNIVE